MKRGCFIFKPCFDCKINASLYDLHVHGPSFVSYIIQVCLYWPIVVSDNVYLNQGASLLKAFGRGISVLWTHILS